MRVDWSAISPERRRLILVASDEKYEALRYTRSSGFALLEVYGERA